MTKDKIGKPEQQESAPLDTDGLQQAGSKDLAKIGLDPLALAAGLTLLFTKGSWGDLPFAETYDVMLDQVEASGKGNHTEQRAMLIGQANVLNSIFVEMARRAAVNMGQSLEGMERYMKLALKAQAQSRTTIEALDRLDNGHVQTVRHVHVDNRGGQAIIAENVHTGEQEIGKTAKQSHATGAAGIGPALPGADPLGDGVPIPGSSRPKAMSNARRHKPGRP